MPRPLLCRPLKPVFVIPQSPQQGMRDPFYPKSLRIFAHAPVPVVVATQAVARVELKLQGISGTPNHRLPIINGRTFELGEEAEVPVQGGKVAVKVIEIKGDSVIAQANGERYELKMRPGF